MINNCFGPLFNSCRSYTNQVDVMVVKSESELLAIAQSVNNEKISLSDLNLSLEKLTLIAPHLHYVDCRNIPFKNEAEIDNFLKNCFTAHHLIINSDKVKNLKDLSKTLQSLECHSCEGLLELNCPLCSKLSVLKLFNCRALKKLDCSYCTSLTELNLSECSALERLHCNCCSILKELDCSHSKALELLQCNGCERLKALELSNCHALKELNCAYCPNLLELNLNDAKALERLHCRECLNLPRLDCSNCQPLNHLDCNNCLALSQINLSHCQALQTLYCYKCWNLQTIISTGLPNCQMVNHSNCPLLSQLPQLPAGAQVFSYNSIGFVSFEIDPEDLTNKPLEVLKHLGEVISRDKRMPNVVYLHSPGLDAGGLRRQLVTTLLQNEFPPEAYKTIGMLIALAALGSLPLGRVLKNNFYYALLHIEEDTPETTIQSLALYGVPDEKIETVDRATTEPIAFAAKGFREIADPKRFRTMPLTDFVNRVAGLEVNWDNFNALYQGPENIKGYFKTFFEKHPHKMIDVIELITSSRALGEEKIKIFVDETLDKRKLFVIETCFQQVTLPSYGTYEVFEEKLLKTIEHTLGHFGKA